MTRKEYMLREAIIRVTGLYPDGCLIAALDHLAPRDELRKMVWRLAAAQVLQVTSDYKIVSLVYSHWSDSQCAPFIQDILDDLPNRDTHRLIFADWLDDREDHENAQKLRTSGVWFIHDDGYNASWNNLPMHWVAWPWLYPTKQWLNSPRCHNLVGKWIENSVDYHQYPWAANHVRKHFRTVSQKT
jgi:uncharacterized protein (TIGR02996 family)